MLEKWGIVAPAGKKSYAYTMEVSLEIVPRSPASLEKDAAFCRSFPGIGCINIPDLVRFPVRSWEACGILGPDGPALIPHLRARDFPPGEPFPHVAYFRERRITRALVIAGDPPEGDAGPGPEGASGGGSAYGGFSPGSAGDFSSASPTLAFIKKLKTEMPELEIYAAFDPYRTNIRYELDYLAAKEAAGTSGFMSQPFFDLRLLEIYAEYLEGKRVFWGVAPVLSDASRAYWESRNRAVFPRSFRTSLSWNTGFAREVMAFCQQNRFNLYLMPIKLDLPAYLSGIFQ